MPANKLPNKELSSLGRAGLKIVNENTILPEIGRVPYSKQDENISSSTKTHRLLSILQNIEWLKKEASSFFRKLF